MALIMLEGFENLGTWANFLRKSGWSYSGNTSAVAVGVGRFGGDCIYVSANNRYITYSPNPILTDSIWIGGAFYKNDSDIPISSSNYPWIKFFSETVVQGRVSINSSWGIDVYTGTTYKFSTAGGVIQDLAWQYIEVYLKVSNTVGEIIIKVDGNEVLNETGYDSQGASGTTITRVDLGYIYNLSDSYWDDLYINDSEFMGEIKVVSQLPTSDGTHGDFLALSAGDHYVEVDDTTPDDDTSYVEGKAKGEKESFGISTTGIDGKIVGVQLNQLVKRTDITTVGVKNLVRVGGSDYLGSDEKFLATDYNYIADVWENNPDTSNPWTKSSIENAEFGIEITTLSTTTTTTTV